MSEPEKFTILSNVIFTRNLILRSFCGIYLAAFLSFYIQAEGKHLSITSISIHLVIDTVWLRVKLHHLAHILTSCNYFQACSVMSTALFQLTSSRSKERFCMISSCRSSSVPAGFGSWNTSRWRLSLRLRSSRSWEHLSHSSDLCRRGSASCRRLHYYGRSTTHLSTLLRCFINKPTICCSRRDWFAFSWRLAWAWSDMACRTTSCFS